VAGIAELGVTSRIIYFGRLAEFSKADEKTFGTEDTEVARHIIAINCFYGAFALWRESNSVWQTTF
jgi:hypothetical protein